MKKFINKIACMCCLVMVNFLTLAAQPEAFNYQGIAIDNNGQILNNAVIGLQFSILNDNNTLLVESHTTTTTSIGHFTADVGFGDNISGDFSAIDWSMGAYFLKIEMDVTGGSNYTYSNQVELVSVPYALVVDSSDPGVPAGPMGPAGEDGAIGATGATGIAGITGIHCWDLNGNGIGDPLEDANLDGLLNALDCHGAAGATGVTGATGAIGAQGAVGAQGQAGGPQGPKGLTGDKGPLGNIFGDPGPTGPRGITGSTGPAGPAGPKGATGPTGLATSNIGQTGPMGPTGPGGGPVGPEGPIGDPGNVGQSGLPGPQGKTGLSFTEVAEVTSIVPDTSSGINLYVDDGTNRADNKPGLRFFNGTSWIDL